jgi:hypothetical protein
MSEAIYALAGTVIGIIGTLLTDIIRGRREDRTRSQEALRAVSSDFAAQIGRIRRYCLQLLYHPEDQGARSTLDGAFTEARANYERLLLTADSVATQEAARYVIHYTFWMTRAANKERTGFYEAEAEMFSWSAKLRAEVRRELGLKHPDNVFKDIPRGLPEPGHLIEESSS